MGRREGTGTTSGSFHAARDTPGLTKTQPNSQPTTGAPTLSHSPNPLLALAPPDASMTRRGDPGESVSDAEVGVTFQLVPPLRRAVSYAAAEEHRRREGGGGGVGMAADSQDNNTRRITNHAISLSIFDTTEHFISLARAPPHTPAQPSAR